MPHAPLDGPRQEASSGTTKSLVILTHGYGASGHDLIELGKQLAPAFPNTTFVAPNAPEPCAIAPDGYQWFPLSPNPPGSFRPPEEYYGGVESAAPVFNDFLDREFERYGVSEDNTVLLGFSQGTMMSLHVGLRREKALSGIIGYSGVLAGGDQLKQEIKSRPPVLIIHGDMDPVVPVQAVPLAREALVESGIDAEWTIVSGIGHTIDELGLLLGLNFLRRHLTNHAG